ncbi:dihydroorotate dehydrogenase [bacterium]|nr:dihydroorotate dehydrogenase [FCB group bacterium]MBL7190498.1 dihydroorotate dehydrogenase [bacterium]
MNKLEVKIGSLTLKNPVMTASGTFGYGDEYISLLDISKLGAIVTKTLTMEPRAGNPAPRIWELPYGMLNSIGLANIGVHRFISEKLPILRDYEATVIANIASADVAGYTEVIKILENEKGISAYELNVSCPNVEKEGMAFGADVETLLEVTRRCREAADKCLIVKLTPNVYDIGSLAQAAVEGGADALTVANTVLGMAVDIESRKPRIPSALAGYSGPGIKPVNLAKLYQVRKAVDVPLIGCGGIMNYRDALEYMITGAAAVQIGSGTYKNPRLAVEVIDDMERYLNEKGIDDIDNLIGTMK